NPCHNGGVCETTDAHGGEMYMGYLCHCSPGYTGVHCQHECSGPLGMEGGIISNEQLSASSTDSTMFGLHHWHPHLARLNKRGMVNAWSPAETDRRPWIQVNLQQRMRITGVLTQGARRMGSSEFVKSFKVVNFSLLCTFFPVCVQIFHGNTENSAPMANAFSPPIEAQYIRLYPQACRGHCTLRMELMGCELTGCSEPLGLKSGHVLDSQLSASSVYRTLGMELLSWRPEQARLDRKGKVNAWTAAWNNQKQWIQVDLLAPTNITGVITQGARDFGLVQFVSSYKLAHSDDAVSWTVYQDESQHTDKIFQGNSDSDTHRKNSIDPPIYGRFLRLLPWSWYGRITLRMELLGCSEEE
uniref:EGF like repeats and discoidin domains 3 n=1 Tax=Myripristis murdjan TaxID=586833 RepID=A0A667YB57_9TELE